MEVRELTDQEAIIALDIENRQRKELSPYERGRSYYLWLHHGLFSSQEALARTLNISASQVSRLISLAQLPPVKHRHLMPGQELMALAAAEYHHFRLEFDQHRGRDLTGEGTGVLRGVDREAVAAACPPPTLSPHERPPHHRAARAGRRAGRCGPSPVPSGPCERPTLSARRR